MKKFTKILLASFALMSLVFAGCNALKTDEAVEDEATEPAVEVTTEVTTPAADTTTEATAQ
ncbi:hypothetical protein HY463_01530 [Candidatus Peregrinibacteria bacterium]|nr:hypothetical protein [Candidatus Peregrinibacteria bacterium]